jgi:uncharacterized protein
MSGWIEDVSALEALYGTPVAAATRKVADRLTPAYRSWIERSRFAVLVTVGPEGTDGSPRGDDGPVVRIESDRQLLMPDWRGNDRIDSLRNIVRDGRASLMFLVPGSANVVRVNGRARVSAAPELLASFERDGKRPRTVIAVEIGEVYFQCARALIRARLWSGENESEGLPSPGEMLAEITSGEVGGEGYDRAWPERAAKTMW